MAAFESTDANTKADLLHDAEKLLVEDMPVIPIVFNQSATMASKDLSKIGYTYYGTPIFTKTKQKNYAAIAKKYQEEEASVSTAKQ